MESRKKALKPTPKLNLVEWADSYRYLSPESSSLPGKWKTSNVEAARGPMLAVTDPRVKKITVMGPTQLLKTELINNIVGYFIHQDPSPMIVMQPTGKIAEAWSKDRLDKMIRDTPVLRGLVKDKRAKDSENTILHKTFPGGHITIVGSNSPSDLASRPVRIVLCDEVDKYPESAGKEGDPIKLIEERTDTFWNALIVHVCSPTVKGRSRIEQEYEQSDKRVFHGRCPYCNKLDELKWVNVKWDNDDPETARYECGQCGHPWTEIDRLKAISNGEYIATAPFNGHAGFKVNKIASPWQELKAIVKKFLEAKDNPEKLKTFVNTQLAETWEEEGDKPDFQRLYERRETYPINTLPKGVVFLTAGADVQKDRIELEIVGWGREKESWSIDYRIFPGDTAAPEVWKKLDEVLNQTWKTHNGLSVQIRMLAVDTGYNTQHVYNWVRKQSPDRVRAVDGRDGLQSVFGTPSDVDMNLDGSRVRRALKLWPVGVSVIKSELYGWLNLNMPEDGKPYPPGYCHFPQYDLEHFKRLTSEQLVKRVLNGRTVYRWAQIYERNEQLDCRVYARAAAAMFGMDYFSETEWEVLEGKFTVPTQRFENVENSSYQTPETNREEDDTPFDDFWSRQNAKKKFW